jgi:hypothetical protein
MYESQRAAEENTRFISEELIRFINFLVRSKKMTLK